MAPGSLKIQQERFEALGSAEALEERRPQRFRKERRTKARYQR